MTNYSDILPSDSADAQRMLSDTDGGGSGHTPYNRVELEIDDDGTVGLYTSTYYGGDGTPLDMWHRRTLVYTVSPNADAELFRDALCDGDRLSALIDRVKAGYSVEWNNGSNMVGRLTEDAEDASIDLMHTLESLPAYSGQVASAEIYLTGGEQSLAEVVGPTDTAEALPRGGHVRRLAYH